MTRRLWSMLVAVLMLAALSVPAAAADGAGEGVADVPHILMFSRTDGFRHSSIEHSRAVIESLAASSGAFTVEFTEDTAVFTPAQFAATDIILFANTTGEHPFSDDQKADFEQWVLDGGGFMGIHAAADTNYNWPFYQELVGAAFQSHPHNGGLPRPFDAATVQVENPDHPINADTDVESFPLREEYYKWRENPRGTQDISVLLSLDESSTYSSSPPFWGALAPAYEPDQPLEWVKTYRSAGRVWYTNLGHYDGTYDRADWQARFLNAVDWVASGVHTGGDIEGPSAGVAVVDGVITVPPGGVTVGFAPPVTALPAGSTASLYNADNVSHNLQAKAFKPGTRIPLFRSDFAAELGGVKPIMGIEDTPPGEYEYYCTIHGNMVGTITIV